MPRAPWGRWRALTALLAVLGALLLAPAAMGTVPAGFTEGLRLEPAASFVAGKPVRVYCAVNEDVWFASLAEWGVHGTAVTLTIGGDETYLSPERCRPLRLRLNRRGVDTYDLAAALLTLTHESVHLSGERDESATDCRALALVPVVAKRYFGITRRALLHEIVADAWDVHYSKSPDYLRLC